MKPKPFEIIVEFIPQSTKTGITYEAHQKGSLIRCKDCFWYRSVELKADGTHDKRFKPSRCALWDEDMNDTDFCSYAMEKNDEKEEDKRSD